MDVTVRARGARSVDVAMDTTGLAGLGAGFVGRLRLRLGGVVVPSELDVEAGRLVATVPLSLVDEGLPAGSGAPLSGEATPAPAAKPTTTASATASATATATATGTATGSSAPSETAGVGASPTGGGVESQLVTTQLSLTAAAAAYGSGGDFTATSLDPSMSWAAGMNSGSFTYSYPLPLPPAVVGPTPSLSLGYDSGSVDGRTSASNGQVSSVGSGWSLNEAFIERRYKPCSKEPDAGPKGMLGWGDKCWGGDKLSIVLNGKSQELIPAGTSQGLASYRLREDDGWRVLRRFGEANGGEREEWFSVWTPDGMEYLFGTAGTRGVDDESVPTNAVATVPVFGDDPSEPCYDTAGGRPGYCQQGYRFYLTAQEDPTGVRVVYLYAKGQNRYGMKGNPSSTVSYDRDVRLVRVLYGRYPRPTSQVEFGYVSRCTAAVLNPGTACPGVLADPSAWPDVPADIVCSASPCSDEQLSPTFFSTVRLQKVRTFRFYRAVGTTSAVWRPVDRVEFRHGFPDPDGTGPDTPELWLDQILRIGASNTASEEVVLPVVQFRGTGLQNRVDDTGVQKLVKYRMLAIRNELGAETWVTYGSKDACTNQTVQNHYDADLNTRTCFPRWWTPPAGDAGFGWFHKYLVTSVREVSPVSGTVFNDTPQPEQQSEPMLTEYGYDGGAAWHHDDDSMTELTQQSWGDWRGYQAVDVWVRKVVGGKMENTYRSKTRRYFFRGMNGDRLGGGGSRSVSVSGEELKDQVDEHWRSGLEFEENVYNGSLTPLTRKITLYTGVKTADTSDHDAITVRATRTLSRQAFQGSFTAAGNRYQWEESTWSLGNPLTDPKFGMLLSRQVEGNPGTAVDDTCTQIGYETVNTLAEWVARPVTSRLYGAGCAGVAASNLLRSSATDYDAKGLEVLTRVFTSNTSTSTITVTTRDGYGRPKQVVTCGADATGTTCPDPAKTTMTTTAYVPDGGAALEAISTTVKATSTVSLTTTTKMNGTRDLPVEVIDANGQSKTMRYDTLGRLVAGRLPGDATDRVTYDYELGGGIAPPSVITSTLVTAGADPVRRETVTWYDGFGRLIRSDYDLRSYTAQNIRYVEKTVNVTRYDDRGNTVGVSGPVPLAFTNPALAAYWGSINPSSMPSEVRSVYDALNRVVSTEQWAITTQTTATKQYETLTSFAEPGRITVNPPTGGNTSTITDHYGRTSVVEEMNSDGTVYARTRLAYTNAGDLLTVKMDGTPGPVTSMTYDLAGRKTSTTDVDAGTSSSVYDWRGLVTQTTSPTGAAGGTATDVKLTSYDLAGRPTSTKVNGVTTTTATYDTGGTAFLGRLVSATSTTTDPDTNQALTTTSTVLGYDSWGRVTSSRLQVPAGFGVPQAITSTESTTYDTEGHVATVTYSPVANMPGETVTAKYTDLGRPSTLTSSISAVGSTPASLTPLVASTVFNSYGRLTSRRWGWGSGGTGPTRTYAYDPIGRLVQAKTDVPQSGAGTSAGLEQDDTYTYVGDRELRQVTDNLIKQAQCYTYDAQFRLVRAATMDVAGGQTCSSLTSTAAPQGSPPANATPYDLSWTYDIENNLTQVRDNLTAVTTTLGGRAATNQPRHAATSITVGAGPAMTMAYDAAGRLTTRNLPGGTTETLTWDQQGRLASSLNAPAGGGATSLTRFAYGPDGSRLIRKTATETTLTLGATEITYPAGGGNPTTRRYYTLAGAQVAMRTTTGPAPTTPSPTPTPTTTAPPAANYTGLTWLANDGQASTDVTIDATTGAFTRVRYQPYGKPRTSPAALGTFGTGLNTDKGWLGQTLDATTGLTYLNARYYDTNLAQFTAPDPLLDPTNPRTLNPYTYANGNPIAYTDPTGLSGDCVSAQSPRGSAPPAPCPPNSGGGTSRGGTRSGGTSNGGGTSSGGGAGGGESGPFALPKGAGKAVAETATGLYDLATNPKGVVQSIGQQFDDYYSVLVPLCANGDTMACVRIGTVSPFGDSFGRQVVADYQEHGIFHAVGYTSTHVGIMLLGTKGAGSLGRLGAVIGRGAGAVTAAETGAGAAGKALRPVGQFLESVDDVMTNPRLLEGKTPAQVESMIGDTEGWQVGKMNKGRRKGQGWTFRELNSRGTDFTDRYIQWNPGSPRHFSGNPYWKVSSGAGGTVRVPQ